MEQPILSAEILVEFLTMTGIKHGNLEGASYTDLYKAAQDTVRHITKGKSNEYTEQQFEEWVIKNINKAREGKPFGYITKYVARQQKEHNKGSSPTTPILPSLYGQNDEETESVEAEDMETENARLKKQNKILFQQIQNLTPEKPPLKRKKVSNTGRVQAPTIYPLPGAELVQPPILVPATAPLTLKVKKQREDQIIKLKAIESHLNQKGVELSTDARNYIKSIRHGFQIEVMWAIIQIASDTAIRCMRRRKPDGTFNKVVLQDAHLISAHNGIQKIITLVEKDPDCFAKFAKTSARDIKLIRKWRPESETATWAKKSFKYQHKPRAQRPKPTTTYDEESGVTNVQYKFNTEGRATKPRKTVFSDADIDSAPRVVGSYLSRIRKAQTSGDDEKVNSLGAALKPWALYYAKYYIKYGIPKEKEDKIFTIRDIFIESQYLTDEQFPLPQPEFIG